MNLLLALSCLQGRLLRAAASELLALAPDGLQLTPGNVPNEGDEAWLASQNVTLQTHHGFTWAALRRPVWGEDLRLLTDAHSVHPPKAAEVDELPRETVLEVMYPGYALGTGAAVERAMDLGLRLAVDVSHVFLQLSAGVMPDATWRRLRAYANIHELHLSDNDGRHDRHMPITSRTFGLGWARERAQSGTPVVLECYMHQMSVDDRRRQVDLARGSR
jgi:hypothetical protein